MPRPISKIRCFYVSTQAKQTPWSTIAAALTAANDHLAALQAAGDMQFNSDNVRQQYQDLAAGLYIGILHPTETVPLPEGCEEITFDSEYWNAPPDVHGGPPEK